MPKSIRQDKLPQYTLDLAVWVLENTVTGWTKTNCLEVKLDRPVHNMIFGGESVLVRHGGTCSACYEKHAEDENWSVIYEDDCTGNPARAERLLPALVNTSENDDVDAICASIVEPQDAEQEGEQ